MGRRPRRRCAELIPQARDARIAGVCVSGLGPCLLACDERRAGRCAPAILYGIDMRATAEIAELTAALRRRRDPRALRQGAAPRRRSGRSSRGSAATSPRSGSAPAAGTCANSFVVARLTGEYVLDHHSASQCDPLYDLREHRWVDGLGGGDRARPRRCRGCLAGRGRRARSRRRARRRPACRRHAVAAGTVDAWAEAFSVGVRDPGDLMLMYGTTMFFVEVVDATPSPGAVDDRRRRPGTRSLAAGMATVGRADRLGARARRRASR